MGLCSKIIACQNQRISHLAHLIRHFFCDGPHGTESKPFPAGACGIGAFKLGFLFCLKSRDKVTLSFIYLVSNLNLLGYLATLVADSISWGIVISAWFGKQPIDRSGHRSDHQMHDVLSARQSTIRKGKGSAYILSSSRTTPTPKISPRIFIVVVAEAMIPPYLVVLLLRLPINIRQIEWSGD